LVLSTDLPHPLALLDVDAADFNRVDVLIDLRDRTLTFIIVLPPCETEPGVTDVDRAPTEEATEPATELGAVLMGADAAITTVDPPLAVELVAGIVDVPPPALLMTAPEVESVEAVLFAELADILLFEPTFRLLSLTLRLVTLYALLVPLTGPDVPVIAEMAGAPLVAVVPLTAPDAPVVPEMADALLVAVVVDALEVPKDVVGLVVCVNALFCLEADTSERGVTDIVVDVAPLAVEDRLVDIPEVDGTVDDVVMLNDLTLTTERLFVLLTDKSLLFFLPKHESDKF